MRKSKKEMVLERFRSYHFSPKKLDFMFHDESLYDKKHKFFSLTIYTTKGSKCFDFYFGKPYDGFDIDKYNEAEFNNLDKLLTEDETTHIIERTNRIFI